MRRVVLMMLDGLRRDFVDAEHTPNLAAFSARAESFTGYRSVFPSVTRVVSATLATGCWPMRHELQGNTLVLLENGRLVRHDAGDPDFLQHKRRVTGRSLAAPTLAERLKDRGGAIVFNNVSPGAAYAHDPDGHGRVYHRAGSFGPGRQPVPHGDRLDVMPDLAGDRAMTERFVAEALSERRPAFAVLWLCEPDHIQHATALGSPEHLLVLGEADRLVARVVEAVDRRRRQGDEILLLLGSDHGHQSVTGVVDIEAELIAAGLKAGPDSGDVVVAANGTAALVYAHPDSQALVLRLGVFLAAQPWVGKVIAAGELRHFGQAARHGLAYAVALRSDDAPNAHGVPGSGLAAKPSGGKPDRLGCGQHGGLGSYEQMPFLMIDGPGFTAGDERSGAIAPVDFAPTILSHLGVAADGMDGRPLQVPNTQPMEIVL